MSDSTIHNLLTRGAVDVIVREELEKKLKAKTPLRVKFGIDPTKPDLHLGHAVPLRKLKQFQDAGHHVILLIGGFTATIGDPTGKDAARPPLTAQDVERHAEDYLEQAGKIIDLKKAQVVNNYEWLATMEASEMLGLAAKLSASRIFERDMFQERLKAGASVGLHELIYPALQGYDSVVLNADIEIGGTDQLFNLLMGRELQKKYETKAVQNVLTVPILEGLDGHEKMSKSLGNYIAINDAPNEMFGKIMSIPDTLMGKYFELLTDENLGDSNALIKRSPRDAKVRLAKVIIRDFHDDVAADMAEKDFVQKFVKKEVPDEMPEFEVAEKNIGLLNLITQVTKFAASNSEARRLVQDNGVSLDGEKVTDPHFEVGASKTAKVLKVGKRKFAKIVFV